MNQSIAFSLSQIGFPKWRFDQLWISLLFPSYHRFFHDSLTPLTVIPLNLELLLRQSRVNSSQYKSLLRTLEAAYRLKALFLLTWLKTGYLTHHTFNLTTVIQKSVGFCNRLIISTPFTDSIDLPEKIFMSGNLTLMKEVLTSFLLTVCLDFPDLKFAIHHRILSNQMELNVSALPSKVRHEIDTQNLVPHLRQQSQLIKSVFHGTLTINLHNFNPTILLRLPVITNHITETSDRSN